MYQTIIKKTNTLNISKTDKEFFIDISTCDDTDILKLLACLSLQLILHSIALRTLDIKHIFCFV